MKLNNGRKPIMWTVWEGGEGERPYVGAVLAHRKGYEHDPYVVWSCASDDGINFDCFWGHYCQTIDQCVEPYLIKRQEGEAYAFKKIERYGYKGEEVKHV